MEKNGYVKVAEKEEVPPNSMKAVEGIDRVAICLINLNGEYHAVSGICPHKGGPLYRPESLRGQALICPWHKAVFRIRDGHHSFPAPRDLRTFEVELDGNSILLKLP